MVIVDLRIEVRDWGPIVAVIPGVCGMFYAFLADYFSPGSDTEQTNEHIEKMGMEATPRNRIIVFCYPCF